MIHVIRSEWIKFRSVRSTVLLVLAAGLLVVVVAFFAARSENHDAASGFCRPDIATTPAGSGSSSEGQGQARSVQASSKPCPINFGDITVGIPFALFLFGALGVQIIGQEYRFSTIRPTFTAVPRRGRVLAAKLLVVTAACAVVAAVMLALCALLGTVMVHDFTFDGIDQRVAWGTVLFIVGWTALGMGVGSIVRQPIAGMLILLVEAFVLENLLRHLVHGSGKWLPFVNGIQMTFRDPDHSGELRSVTGGGIYFFVVAAVIWAVGAVLAHRRDA